MKVIIAGTRSCENYDLLIDAINESGFDIDEIVSGGANGVDKLGERFAIENNIGLKIFPADWNRFGKSAGVKRNIQMSEYVGPEGALILLWDGRSRGSHHMLTTAFYAGLGIFIKTIR